MFYLGSRYEKVKDYVAEDSSGRRNKVKRMRRMGVPSKAFSYIVRDGDRLDLLANRFYGDPTKFWLICDANETLYPADLLIPGRRIVIPKEGL